MEIYLPGNYLLPQLTEYFLSQCIWYQKVLNTQISECVHSKILLVGDTKDLDTCIIRHLLVLPTRSLLGDVCDCGATISSWLTPRRAGSRFSALKVGWWGAIEILPVRVVVLAESRHHTNRKELEGLWQSVVLQTR